MSDILDEMRGNSCLELKRKNAYDNPKKYGLPYLKFLDEQNIRNTRDIFDLGLILINNNIITDNIDYYRLIERIIIASLELGKQKIALKYIKTLQKKFGNNSIRVKILVGMYYEFNQKYDDALKYYLEILKNDPNNITITKRIIGVYIHKKDYKNSIIELNKYLKIYCNDKNAWKELLNLYLKMNNYEYAKFCCEELILLPGNDNYQLYNKYADILYNISGNKNIILAAKYYMQSLLLSDDKNTRALWGIIMCYKKQKNLNGIDKDLVDKCRDKIMKNYSNTMFAQEIKQILLDLTQK